MTMKRLGTTIRIGFVMTVWSATVLLGLHLFQVFDDGHETILDSRTRLCEAVAVSCSQLATHDDREGIQLVLDSFIERDGDVLSARFQPSATDEGAQVALTAGQHDQHWNQVQASYQAADQIAVPVFCAGQPCGKLEVAFRSPVRAAILGFIRLPSPRVTLVASFLNLLVFSIWIRRCFREPDASERRSEHLPSAAGLHSSDISTLDEGPIDSTSISTFAANLSRSLDHFQATPFVTIQRRPAADDTRAKRWLNCLQGNRGEKAPTQDLYQLLHTPDGEGAPYRFKPSVQPALRTDVRTSPNLSSVSTVSLFAGDDEKLGKTLERLKASQKEIEERNRQLTYLATRDPLTGCLNRRSFFEHFDELWRSSKRYGHPLSCVMVDVDHFKAINDEHGHQVGDQVLRQVASALKNTARETDHVCRYGGEEFCILLPHVDLAGASFAAERFREAIERLQVAGLTVTASLGCSDREQGAVDAEQMLDQADQALYHSKRNGRNRTTSFDQLAASSI